MSISWRDFSFHTHPDLTFSLITNDSKANQVAIADELFLSEDTNFELSHKQWDELRHYLTNDLDDNRKSLILKLMRSMVYFINNKPIVNQLTPTQIKKELISFKETANKLIKQSGLDPTVEPTLEVQMAINNAYNVLSIDSLTILNLVIHMMTRRVVTTFGSKNCPLDETLHPSQYFCASIISLEIISGRKHPKNPKGAGRANDDKRGLYHRIFELWRDLGETNTKTYNGEYTDDIVSFAHALINFAGDTRAMDTVRKDLAKYKKIYMRNS